MPVSMHNLARVLIQDGRASANDAKILSRVVESGHATRDELNTAKDVIENSALPHSKKRYALRHLEAFLDDTAKGLEAQLYGVDPSVANQFRWADITTTKQLLTRASSPAQREALANQLGGLTEKEIRQLAKQADLQRVAGIDDKMAKVLVDLGVDSVPELAGRNASNLFDKLKEFSATQEAWIIKFKLPSKDDVATWKAQAEGLDRVLSFGRPTSGWELLTTSERVDLMFDEDNSLKTEWTDKGLKDFFADHGVPERVMNAADLINEDGASYVADSLEWQGVDVSAQDILDGTFTEADLPSGVYVEFSTKPSITEYSDPTTGEFLGAKLTWSVYPDPAEYTFNAFYDAKAGAFTETIEYDHYNSEVNDRSDYWFASDRSGSVAAERAGKLKDLTEGLHYISDGDEPFEVTGEAAFGKGVITADAFKEQVLWSGSNDEVTIRDADALQGFWDYYTDPQTQSAGDAAKFSALQDFMESTYDNLTLVKTGPAGDHNKYVWLVGTDEQGNLQGLRAKSIET